MSFSPLTRMSELSGKYGDIEYSPYTAPANSSIRNTKIEILGITVSHVVTIVGVPSYTSGAQ